MPGNPCHVRPAPSGGPRDAAGPPSTAAIRRRQAEGIAAARLRGIRFGREPRPLPRNFIEIYELWKAGAIPATEAAKRCGMARSTFRYRAESIRKNSR